MLLSLCIAICISTVLAHDLPPTASLMLTPAPALGPAHHQLLCKCPHILMAPVVIGSIAYDFHNALCIRYGHMAHGLPPKPPTLLPAPTHTRPLIQVLDALAGDLGRLDRPLLERCRGALDMLAAELGALQEGAVQAEAGLAAAGAAVRVVCSPLPLAQLLLRACSSVLVGPMARVYAVLLCVRVRACNAYRTLRMPRPP